MAPCAPVYITTQMYLVRASVYSSDDHFVRSDYVVITMVLLSRKMKRCIQVATEMRKRRCDVLQGEGKHAANKILYHNNNINNILI